VIQNSDPKINPVKEIKCIAGFGFTLLEVMIALVITALIAVMAFQSLDGASRGSEKTNEVLNEINQLDRVWQIIGLDLRNIIKATSANATLVFEAKSLSGSGENADQMVLMFKRSGWVNFANLPRSDLQIVSYQVKDGELWRYFLPELNQDLSNIDMEKDDEVTRQLLMKKVDDFQLRFLSPTVIGSNGKSALDGNDFTRYWIDEWPDATRGATGLPLAVEISIKLKSDDDSETKISNTKGIGETKRLFAFPEQ
jgi:general secretion pathway protein J